MIKQDYYAIVLDYIVTEMKCTLMFDYMERESFEEFYIEFKKICDKYNVHVSNVIKSEAVLDCDIND